MSTKHPREEDLLAILYGESDEQTVRHLQLCSLCQANLKEMAEWHFALDSASYRIHCPEPDSLVRYLEQSLPKDIEQNVHEHVMHCVHCQWEINELEGLVASPDEQAGQGWLALLGDGVRRFFRAYLAPVPLAQPARGELASLLRYHTRDLDILLSVMGAQGQETRTIVGQLVPLSETIVPPFHGSVVWENAAEDAQPASINELGEFLLPDLPIGHQNLRVEIGSDVVVMMDIDL